MRTTHQSVMVGSIVWLALLGCGGSAKPTTTPAGDATTPEASNSADASSSAPNADDQAAATSEATSGAPGTGAQLDVPPHGASSGRIMKAHFTDALLIRQAVIDGRPDLASNPATVIANAQTVDKAPDGWRPFILDMQQTAQRITDASTPAVVAAAAADLGVACGACHVKFGGPEPSKDAPPARGETVESRMAHHAWATERLWEALSVPSDAAWYAGAKELSTDPFPAEILKEGGVNARSAAADFVKLVAKAPAKKSMPDRAALYAELLVTCGTCHQAMLGED